MQHITQPLVGLLALSTLMGVCVHDLHLDKVMVHAVSHHADGGGDSKVSVSSNPHTHSERSSFSSKTQPSIARDPREDKAQHQNQTDYFRLPGSADTDHTLMLV